MWCGVAWIEGGAGQGGFSVARKWLGRLDGADMVAYVLEKICFM